RSKLEYGVQAGRQYIKNNIGNIEKVQHRATKMIKDYKYLSYEERLVRTGLTTLEERRTRGDLIEVFKMIKGLNKSDYKSFFTIVPNNITRGHKLKIVKGRSRLNIRQKFFSQRVVNDWNALPVIVVESESVNRFKNNYDKYVGNKKL